MADYTIAADEQGVYEVQLEAGTPIVVNFKSSNVNQQKSLQVNVHNSTAPVYVRYGDTVEVREPKAFVVTSGTWLSLADDYAAHDTVAIVSAATATVSVTRS